MKTVKIWNDSPSDKQLDLICSELESGSVVIIPTDTLYGICCDGLNMKAIEKVCKIKGINPDKSNLSIICSDISMAAEYSKIDNGQFKLIKDNTPGPFTFLLRSVTRLPKVFNGRKTVGVRIPDCNTSRMISERLGHPLLTTSIEYSDEDHCINPQLIAEAYERKADLMVEGEDGSTLPSTVIDCTGDIPEIVRDGRGELR